MSEQIRTQMELGGCTASTIEAEAERYVRSEVLNIGTTVAEAFADVAQAVRGAVVEHVVEAVERGADNAAIVETWRGDRLDKRIGSSIGSDAEWEPGANTI